MSSPGPDVDAVVVGGGIVGLAAAHALGRRGLTVTLVEKERSLATHQTGHNSGVVHSGVYYAPGSRKATLVARGRELLAEFCAEHGIEILATGKVIVASRPAELARLGTLFDRGRANGVELHRIGPAELGTIEPAVRALGALHVPRAAIVDYSLVTAALAEQVIAGGGRVLTSWPVSAVASGPRGVTVAGPAGSVRARILVNCAGLHSDRVAALAGVDTGGVRILPFRGEYLDVAPPAADLVRGLIYPLPDPAFPFLGVHLTRMVGGGVHAGPNAVPALAREGYRWGTVDRGDLREILTAGGTWRLARRYWRTGAAEIGRSLVRPAFVRAVRRLVPDIGSADLAPGGSGVRAQAVDAGGRLLDDFEIRSTTGQVHVLNAPSPAATASLAIGEVVADTALGRT